MTPAQLTLPAEPASVPQARRFVCDSLTSLGAAPACGDAETLTSELATNAVIHARTPFTVEVSRDGQIVRICVLDTSPAPPRLRDYGLDATTGRGMRLVASLAVDWGVQPQGRGKTVWFELPADGRTAFVPTWDDDEDIDVETLLAAFDGDDAGGAGAVARAA